jgi:DNA-binding LacI/PurR family transcriptional regulator
MLDLDRLKRELDSPNAAPLHKRLSGALQSQITDGTLRAGDTLPPERALQDTLDISRSTVRQAIKGLTDAGFVKSVVGAGTFVLAPPVERPARNHVGVIVPSGEFHVYYNEFATTFGLLMRNAGYSVDWSAHQDRSEQLSEIVQSLIAQDVGAVVLAVTNRQADISEIVEPLQAAGAHVVLVARYVGNHPSVDYIGVDNVHIGMEATRLLIASGHRRIVHLTATPSSTAKDRRTGYLQAMAEAGLEPHLFVPPLEQPPTDAEFAPLLLDRSPETLWKMVADREVTAAFTFNDMMASWVQKELRNQGLATPRDLSLISVDNMPYAGFFDAPLTTFALPGAEMGRRATDLLLRRLRGEYFPPQDIRLPAQLILRESISPLE